MANNDDKSSIRVLLIDRQRMLSGQIKDAERNGRDIDVVGESSTVEQALAVIAKLKPDIVLFDAESDDTASVGRLSEIIAASPLSRLLILAKNAGDGVSEWALLEGAHGLLVRTTAVETLMTAVRKVHDGELWFDRKLTSRIIGRAGKRNGGGSEQETMRINNLTKRELEITRLIAAGLANKDIASRLLLSEKTVRNHLSTIYCKMGVTNRLGLALFASKNGLGS